MPETIIKAPSVTLENLQSIFIEMTANNCNLRCKHCYINFINKEIKDYIPLEVIKQNISSADKSKLEFIHLTGAEPMMHPDFNAILRYCLKYSNVVIHTNALNINDKKARFLKKVEDENNLEHEIVFMISIDSYLEKENDEIRGRGSYRKAVHAIQSLIKYDFNPIISVVNYNNIPVKDLKEGFKELFDSINFETTDINFKIIPYMNKDNNYEMNMSVDMTDCTVDCKNSRTLTLNGIFSCPLLTNDNRGKLGTDFNNYSKVNYLETPYCTQCIANSQTLFSLEL
jgi:MoaA/NifB/PqqE/SkfB family radical SAM enzyme